MNGKSFEREVVDGQESIVIESTLPPTSSRQMLADEGATIMVFSHDAGLARVIRSVAADRYPFRIIDEWHDLLKQVGRGQGRIVVLDVDALNSEVEEALAELNRCSDWLVIIIAAKQHQAQDFMRFWSERRIHRLLIKPAAAGITRLLLESAFARFIELRELHENTDSMEIPPELLEAETAKPRRWRRYAIAALLALGVGAGVWFAGLRGGDEPVSILADGARQTPAQTQPAGAADAPGQAENRTAAPAGASAAAAATQAPQPDPYDDLLLRARAAESRGRFAEPVGDNAIDYYLSILVQDPVHALARERLDVILEDLFATAQAQILERDFGAADTTLKQIARAAPGSTRLEFLGEQLVRLREADAALEVAQQAAAPRPQPAAAAPVPLTELQSMVTLARLRLDEGALVAPAGDSARDYLLRARDLGIVDATLSDLADAFAGQAVTAIPAALARGDVDAAAVMLQTATDLGSQDPGLIALQPDVNAALRAREREMDQSLHAQALLRIDNGEFIGEDNSAIALLGRLRSRAADPGLIGDLETQLTSAMSQAIRDAIDAQRWNTADALLAGMQTAALDEVTVSTLARAVTVARRQDEYLANAVPVGELTLLASAPAAYPRSARINEITGWVDLHFTVDTDGVTKDIEVVAAEPQGQFEAAALEALAQYRFEPFELESRRYERRVRLRMRFELD